MKLKENIKISGTIEVLTGLHIGAGNEAIEIGGLDNQVIKNPKTVNRIFPVLLKRKMRFISEWAEGKLRLKQKRIKNEDEAYADVHNCDDDKCSVCRVFGSLKTHKR